MRILMINSIYGVRSSGRSMKELANKLTYEGHEVFVATPQKNCDAENFYRIGNLLDHKLHAFKARVFGKQGYYSKRATKKLVGFIEHIKPDVVHIQVIHGNFINEEILFSYLSDKKIPVLFVLDDCWFYTGKCFHYTTANCFKWQESCGNCPKLKDYMMPSLFFDKTKEMLCDKKRYYDSLSRYAVIAVSDWLLAEAKKSIMKDAFLLKRIYNSVDIDTFKPTTSDIKGILGITNSFVILGVSVGWDNSKGLNLFIKLASLIPENWIIVLVGEMPHAIELPSNIISVGLTESVYELSEYYSMADVFVQMSIEETFGKVTAEALACGTPAIVFDSTANPELIGHNCGYVVKRGDIDMMIDKLNIIKAKGKETYSDSCRTFVEQNMNKDKNLEEFIDTYKVLLDI